MNEQDKTPIFDSKEYAKQVSELISKIESRKLSKEQLKDAQKSLADIQKLASEAIEKFKDILPDLTPTEKRIVDAQKFGIADSVINQIFDNSNNNLNEAEQAQFIELLDKVLKAAPKREKNKIFKGSDNLKEALYLHNDNARREKLRK
ncbi:hypothetical protein [Acinetobacter sp. YH12049]|jgi:hypothetical protein|uniref:hypothetical protein n=1 Tax=Acinetobacter sp. YH12049 TaxID=2601054 RepID=UPI0015D25161|nr:hypothetical protein [Acinetobacter sp. YH12049]